ncbi:MAG: hypothetical protein ACQESG_05495 [Nanobdellota archaeon]
MRLFKKRQEVPQGFETDEEQEHYFASLSNVDDKEPIPLESDETPYESSYGPSHEPSQEIALQETPQTNPHKQDYKARLLQTFTEESLFIQQYGEQVEAAMRSLFFQRPFDEEERDRVTRIETGHYSYDTLDQRTNKLANESLRNSQEIGDIIEILKKNRHTRQDSGDINPTPHRGWQDILQADTTVSHVDEKESLTSILGHAGSFIKIIPVYQEKPGSMEILPIDYGNESGLIPFQSSDDSFSPGIVHTPTRKTREANEEIAKQYVHNQNAIINKVESMQNARLAMLLLSLKAKTDEEQEIHQIMEEKGGKAHGMEYTTTVDDIMRAKEYIHSLKEGNHESLQYVHPTTIKLIESYNPPTDHNEISELDQTIMSRKGISNRRYVTEYKQTPQQTLDQLAEIRERHTSNLLIGDPFVQLLDSLVRLTPDILADEISDYIVDVETSTNFKEKLDLLPQSHPQKLYWEEKKQGAELFELLGIRFVYDHQSTVNKTQDVLIDPAINEIEDPTNKTYAALIKQRYPEGLDFFGNEDMENPDQKTLYDKFEDEMNTRNKAPRFYIGANLSPFHVAESLWRDSKSRGRQKSQAGIYLDPQLDMNKELANIQEHYPTYTSEPNES